jgi:hypothetical protein
MNKNHLVSALEHLSQEDLKEVVMRAAELLHVKHGSELTVVQREVLETKMAEVQESLGESKDWVVVRERLLERLKW